MKNYNPQQRPANNSLAQINDRMYALHAVHTPTTDSPDKIERHATRILPGAYTSGTPTSARLAKLSAGIARMKPQDILSHFSAATLWSLPEMSRDPQIHILRHPNANRRRVGFTIHSDAINRSEIIEVSGLRVTSLERTIIDCAKLLPPAESLAVLDHGLAAGVPLETLKVVAQRQARMPSNLTMLLRMAVNSSESPPESMMRYWMHRAGLADIETQFPIRALGKQYYVDCAVKRARLVAEYDGRIKYENPRALYDEKVREDAIRTLGWNFIRVTAADLRRPELLVRRFKAYVH